MTKTRYIFASFMASALTLFCCSHILCLILYLCMVVKDGIAMVRGTYVRNPYKFIPGHEAEYEKMVEEEMRMHAKNIKTHGKSYIYNIYFTPKYIKDVININEKCDIY